MEKAKKSFLTKFTAANVAKIAILTALSFVLYAFGKFNVPFMFPGFLEFQFSELPALLAGFSIGPISGCLVIIFKCLLKFPLSSTAFVGELTDILLGVLFVLPASLLYKYNKCKKTALIGILIGIAASTAGAIVVNRFIAIPFYLKLYFDGNWQPLLSIVRPLYKNVTVENFYRYYLLLAILPFNLLRCGISGLLTFAVYKRVSKALHFEFQKKKSKKTGDEAAEAHGALSSGVYKSSSAGETRALGKRLGEALSGGEVILLFGELGAGKTTFAKGIAEGLGITAIVTSPTFTFMNIYEGGRLPLYHIDMYRAGDGEDVYELGIEEYINSTGVTVIEWNKFSRPFDKAIKIEIKYLDEGAREIEVKIENTGN
ncbi:MAG TPA: tRNA (adenosine(37)-N6)-threonylcarbamoyltransferase complex ATPase subunit type 1 TsaE [Eubacteriales bacterium]|jgi:tRNA threonylcarbamoyl adenosine modification protein YjeE|nr:tRNA (adenosine(37)-N6)-threonylcarbamoyltransferase complex ATPase subunit type 1 TsaE [Eubacteriales bacterium]HRU84384.1 tRNA (adenosine(37)-N6)-threonylcarbamoyltransferase complex ATPase subunit type 1 TsaE [Eubacteriales bacterium]